MAIELAVKNAQRIAEINTKIAELVTKGNASPTGVVFEGVKIAAQDVESYRVLIKIRELLSKPVSGKEVYNFGDIAYLAENDTEIVTLYQQNDLGINIPRSIERRGFIPGLGIAAPLPRSEGQSIESYEAYLKTYYSNLGITVDVDDYGTRGLYPHEKYKWVNGRACVPGPDEHYIDENYQEYTRTIAAANSRNRGNGQNEQNTQRGTINDGLTLEAMNIMKENNIELDKVIVHAPYIVNLGNNTDPEKWQFSQDFIRQELDRCETLGIKYPANAHPILYIYIVPDDNYGPLLRIPNYFDKGNGGGRPVPCYDLDGFHYAYGISQNLLENYSQKESSISQIVNNIHELTHMVHSLFFSLHQTICEGFAETIPLYALDYEKKFTEHKDVLTKMDENQILTAREMLDSERKGKFGEEAILPNRTCSFRLSYISSYLLVRGCIETIVEKNKISKSQAIQQFLEILKQSDYINEWLFWDIADTIGIPKNTLLDGKDLQIKALNSIKNQD